MSRRLAQPNRNGGGTAEKNGRAASGGDQFEIDDMDYQIIALMREDGRISNRDVAKKLGITEATVRARLRRLEERQTMRVVAMADLSVAGFSQLTAVGVQVKGRPAADVAAELAAYPQVLTVNIVIGTHDIEIALATQDQQELATLLTDTLARLPGVFRLTPGLALNVLKYKSDWVPFT
jgi:Lrp/AsnC family transcriptional regulator for asnA, asnC and gidA